MSVIIILADGFEELEAISIIDILRRAEIEVVTASLKNTKVSGAHNIIIEADTELKKIMNQSEKFEMVILPGGGGGTQNMLKDKTLIELLLHFNSQKKHIAAICAAPLVLAEIGILKGKKATAFPGIPLKDAFFQESTIIEDENILTSRGPATSPYFAFRIVEKLKGRETSEQVKKDMLFHLL